MTTADRSNAPAEADRLPGGAVKWMIVALVAGAGCIGLSILLSDWRHFLRSYLASFAFVLSLSLGALFFVIIQHLTRSGWSVAVRRVAEVMAAAVLPLSLLFIPVILGIGDLYEWSHEEEAAHSHKAGWLSPAFFVVRIAVYFGIWSLLARFFLRNSVKQDETGDPAITLKMQKLSPVAMILFGVTVTLVSFDLLMSLAPHWFSTIFGVYYFAGGVVGFFAVLVVGIVKLQLYGVMQREVTTEHYHDLGKQLFGYVVFWAYIAYSQYMLIRYANIPEETVWFKARQGGGWGTVGWILVVGHFALPFLVLLPRAVKRVPVLLAGAAVWLLVMHWVDMYYLVAPEAGEPVAFGVSDVLCALGLTSLWSAAVTKGLIGVSLIPRKDPRLAESLAFENI